MEDQINGSLSLCPPIWLPFDSRVWKASKLSYPPPFLCLSLANSCGILLMTTAPAGHWLLSCICLGFDNHILSLPSALRLLTTSKEQVCHLSLLVSLTLVKLFTARVVTNAVPIFPETLARGLPPENPEEGSLIWKESPEPFISSTQSQQRPQPLSGFICSDFLSYQHICCYRLGWLLLESFVPRHSPQHHRAWSLVSTFAL